VLAWRWRAIERERKTNRDPGRGEIPRARLSTTTQIFLAIYARLTEDALQINRRGKGVAYEDTLRAWVTKASKDTRGLTLKTLDGKSAVIHPPYHIGDDFVSGAMVEGTHDFVAYPYSGLISVQPLGPRPKGF